MSEEVEIENTEDQCQEEKSNDVEESEPKAAAEHHEEEEEKGLMGEIMDMVRSNSPPEGSTEVKDTESQEKNEDAPADEVVEKDSSAEINESKEEEKSEHEDSNNENKEDTTTDLTETTEQNIEATAEPDSNPTTVSTTVEIEIETGPAPDPPSAEDKKETQEIVIPHLLSDEDIIAKGVAESDIEMYRKFHLNLFYSPKVWYDTVKRYSFSTDFIVLNPEEIDALLAIHRSPNDDTAPEVSADTKDVITELQRKIDDTISKYDEGAFIKLNSHSIKDAILDKCEADHVQAVEDGVQNELEIEQQFVNAYLNWRSWRSMSYRENSRTKLPSEQRGNVMRRSIRRIRKSFSGGRSASEDPEQNNEEKDEKPLAEENGKPEEKTEDPDEKKPEAKDEIIADDKEASDEATTEEAKTEETKKDSDEENEAEKTQEVAPVTVEATVEETADSANIGIDDQSKHESNEQLVDTNTKDNEETEKASKDRKDSEIEEIKEVQDEDKPETDEEQRERKVPPPLFGKEQQFVKVKSETRANKVLRAFIKATNAMYRITSGEQAIQLLSTSRVIKEDLEQAKVFANISGAEAVLSVQRWHADVAKYPGMQFRAFVYKNKLTAFSQKDDVAYIPNIVRYKDTIRTKVVHFFNSTMKKSLEDTESYIADIFVGTTKIYVVDLYPFYTGTGACLFTWQQNKKVLLDGPLEFRYIPTPFKNCFTGLQPHWQHVCNNVLQKKKRESQQAAKCLLL